MNGQGRIIWVATVRNSILTDQYNWLIDSNRQFEINNALSEYDTWINGEANKYLPFRPQEWELTAYSKYKNSVK